MRRLAISDFARKDLFTCLGIWLALETACFVLVPAVLQKPLTNKIWLPLSILIGMSGILMIVGSTELATGRLPQRTTRRALRSTVSKLLGTLGLIGIAFPLFIISVQLFIGLFALL